MSHIALTVGSLRTIGVEKQAPPLNELYIRRLRRWNLAVAIVQFVSFAALLSIALATLSGARYVPIWVEESRGTAIRSLGSFPVISTLLPFPAITAIFHLLAYFGVGNYFNDVLVSGCNRLRWIEYSITNGLMTVSLLALAGGGNVIVLVMAVLCNALMQYFGGLHEHQNHRVSAESRSLDPLVTGFVPWIAIWLAIFSYYGINFATSTVSDGFAIVGSFGLSLTFVAPLLWRFTKQSNIENNFRTELAYIILSLTAKLYLDWTVTIGTLAGN